MVKIVGKQTGEVMRGSALSDTIYGNGGNDTIYTYAGIDLIYAGSGDDKINGGKGADLMQGARGNDTYYVDNAGDDVIESASQGHDVVFSSVSYKLTANVEDLILTGLGNLKGTGNGLANAIRGNAGNNIITGKGGADILSGGKGADKFVYLSKTDSGIAEGASDTINGFISGQDKINLKAIDAISHIAGDQAFRFIGTNAFTASTSTPPSSFAEVRFQFDPTSNTTFIDVNIETAGQTQDGALTVSGDTTADLHIVLKGHISLLASDFIL
jgi:Ca2+-binding RTX toxin-like protein